MWRRICICAVTLVALSCPLAAQDNHQPVSVPLSFEATPLFGYRTNSTFTTDPVIPGVTTKVTFEGGFAWGFDFGARIYDEDEVAFRWIRQGSQVRFTPALGPSSSVNLDQFYLDFIHEYQIEEWTYWARPYIMASIGLTHLSGNSSFSNINRFSFGMGGGMKVFPSSHVGFKVQAEWLPIVFNPETTAVCGNNCVVRFGGKLGNQVGFTAGPVFRFQ